MRFHNRLIQLSLVFCFLFTVPIHAQEASDVRVGTYKKWVEKDVRWIITDQERADFKKLSDDKERARFVVEFWERRSPTPGGSRNIVKEEHYRRLAYVDQHFSEDVPGWKTDRGRIYIKWGPPDNIERRSRFESRANKLLREVDSEEWHWSYIEGVGCNVVLEFEEGDRGGEYRLTEAKSDLRPRPALGNLKPLMALGPDCLIEQILFP